MDDPITEIKSEIDKIKNLIGDITSFFNEIKDLRRNLHISAESSISVVNIIILAAKEKILKDVNGLVMITEDKLNFFTEETRENTKNLIERLENNKKHSENIEFDIKNLEELIVRQNTIMDRFRKDSETLKKDVNEKVDFLEFLKLQKSLKSYSQSDEVQDLKSKLADFAEKTSIELIKKEIKGINKKISEHSTKTEIGVKFENVEKEMMNKFYENFTSKKVFDEEIHNIDKSLNKHDDDNRAVWKKVDMITEGFKRKIAELFDIINAKPWDAEIKKISLNLDKTVSKEEIKKFFDDFASKFSKIGKNLTEIVAAQNKFESVIERYDEIFLEKASKDDFSFLSKKLEKCITISEYKDQQDSFNSKFSLINSSINELSATNEWLKTFLSNISLKLENIKRENFEVSNISNTLSNISEILERKADKSDIFIIYDVMGTKDEISKVSNLEELIRKQFLISVGILQSLCRTFMINGENINIIKKQRQDIYKMLENLQKWIKEGNGDMSSVLSIGRSNINLKTEYFEENHLGLLKTARYSRRLRNGSLGTSPKYLKDDLPLLNL